MEGAQDSRHLAGFKEAYAQRQRYWLTAAAAILGSNEIVLDQSHHIGKTQIALRRASEIGANDTDRVVFTRDEARGARWN